MIIIWLCKFTLDILLKLRSLVSLHLFKPPTWHFEITYLAHISNELWYSTISEITQRCLPPLPPIQPPKYPEDCLSSRISKATSSEDCCNEWGRFCNNEPEHTREENLCNFVQLWFKGEILWFAMNTDHGGRRRWSTLYLAIIVPHPQLSCLWSQQAQHWLHIIITVWQKRKLGAWWEMTSQCLQIHERAGLYSAAGSHAPRRTSVFMWRLITDLKGDCFCITLISPWPIKIMRALLLSPESFKPNILSHPDSCPQADALASSPTRFSSCQLLHHCSLPSPQWPENNCSHPRTTLYWSRKTHSPVYSRTSLLRLSPLSPATSYCLYIPLFPSRTQ